MSIEIIKQTAKQLQMRMPVMFVVTFGQGELQYVNSPMIIDIEPNGSGANFAPILKGPVSAGWTNIREHAVAKAMGVSDATLVHVLAAVPGGPFQGQIVMVQDIGSVDLTAKRQEDIQRAVLQAPTGTRTVRLPAGIEADHPLVAAIYLDPETTSDTKALSPPDIAEVSPLAVIAAVLRGAIRHAS